MPELVLKQSGIVLGKLEIVMRQCGHIDVNVNSCRGGHCQEQILDCCNLRNGQTK